MEEALQAWLAERFPGARLVRTWPLTGGVSAVMTAFEAVDSGGAPLRFILRQPGAFEGSGNETRAKKEHEVLRWLAERPFPAPRAYDFFGKDGPFGAAALVIGHIDGEIDLDPKNGLAFAEAMAVGLSALHALKDAAAGLPMLLDRAEAVAKHLSSEPELESDRPYWHALAAWPPPQANPSVLLHGDFWPGNVLWRDGRLVAVIDWEDCGVGDPLADLAMSRLDMFWVLDREAVEHFTERYLTLSGVDAAALPWWDLAAAIRPGVWLETWAKPWPGKGRPDVTFEAMAAKLKIFADEALAKVR